MTFKITTEDNRLIINIGDTKYDSKTDNVMIVIDQDGSGCVDSKVWNVDARGKDNRVEKRTVVALTKEDVATLKTAFSAWEYSGEPFPQTEGKYPRYLKNSVGGYYFWPNGAVTRISTRQPPKGRDD